MFFDLFGAYLEGGTVGSTKGCARVCHYKMQCMTKVIQKLGHHVSNLKVSTLFVFFDFLGLILPRNNRESRAKNGLRVQAICSCDRA